MVDGGDPHAENHGRVLCRLCALFDAPSQFTTAEGYTAGKKNALLQHQVRVLCWSLVGGLACRFVVWCSFQRGHGEGTVPHSCPGTWQGRPLAMPKLINGVKPPLINGGFEVST